jgi:RND family efflux transporter MFP subunit
MDYEPKGSSSPSEISALAELALCENLAQTSGWAAKWSAQVSEADGAILWAPDAVHPIFLCIAAEGEGTRPFLKRSASRDTGVVHDLIRDKRPITIERREFDPKDPWFQGMPPSIQTCLAVPLEAEGIFVGLLGLLFKQTPKTEQKLARLKAFLQHAAPALARAMRAERKTVGMLHAIERLTNLYDLSKAFGATIDLAELNEIIVRKAVDFGVAEVGSLWLLELETTDVVLAATAVNENYDVENPPDAVGSSIVGNLLVSQKTLRDNSVGPDTGLAKENEGYPVRSALGFALVEEGRPVGALVLVNKRGRLAEFTPEDQELLLDLSRQAVRALRNARQYEAEKKVEELDALLTVSREITSTLDLDKVMQKIVNATAVIATYDQCSIAILDRGKLKLGAVSGGTKLDRGDPKMRATRDLLEWVYFGGTNLSVMQDEEGKIQTDRPETEEKFRAYFALTGFRSFHGLLLGDEEGKLGVISFQSRKPLVFDAGTLDLLSILMNQATVALRNAQLYKQVPLPGFLRPLAEKGRLFRGVPRKRQVAIGIAAVVVLILLFVIPWRLRVEGPARVVPGRRAAVTAGVDGIVRTVLHREGDTVTPGEIVATLDPGVYQVALADARAAHQVAESEVVRHREAGDSAAMFEARAKADELKARIALEEERFAHTAMRAPAGGIIVTPRIDERVGQFLKKGTEFCVIADTDSIAAEVAVPEVEASLIRVNQPVDFKLNPYPTRTFHGVLTRVGSHVRDDGKDRYLVCEAKTGNPGGLLKTGMLGRAKIATEKVPIVTAILRKPFRYFWNKLWPLLP